MSSREDPSWPFTTQPASDPDRANTPASEPTGPLFDALDAPLPSELERAEVAKRRSDASQELGSLTEPAPKLPQRSRTTRQERTDVIPRREWRPRDDKRSKTPVRPRTGMRRVRRTIKHIDPVSVLKISAFFYAIFFVVWLMLAAVLYWFTQSLGLLDAIAGGTEAFTDDRVEITLGLVERWAFVTGIFLVVIGCIVNTVVAFLYNVAADLFGGVQVTFTERDN